MVQAQTDIVMFGIFVAQLVEELECVRPCSGNLVVTK